jgi:hypothetical protein
LLKEWRCRLSAPSAAEAGIDFVALTARLEAAPFQSKIKSGFLSATSSAATFFCIEQTHV